MDAGKRQDEGGSEEGGAEVRLLPGWAENAVCPKCKTYTVQRITKRGVRRCECGTEFNLADVERISKGKSKLPRKAKR